MNSFTTETADDRVFFSDSLRNSVKMVSLIRRKKNRKFKINVPLNLDSVSRYKAAVQYSELDWLTRNIGQPSSRLLLRAA